LFEEIGEKRKVTNKFKCRFHLVFLFLFAPSKIAHGPLSTNMSEWFWNNLEMPFQPPQHLSMRRVFPPSGDATKRLNDKQGEPFFDCRMKGWGGVVGFFELRRL